MSREISPGQAQRQALEVHGVVQGVGFRPFVYRLASEEGLSGFIGNNTDGVTIEIEGPPERLASFCTRLRNEAPPLSRIDSVALASVAPTGERGFSIIASEVHGRVSTGIPADAATCPDCLRELLDPADRRYRYPFINCTNCGPRFTITSRIPYDRPQTSMAQFKMCPACQAEYDDPANRRFHAQPNACWDCGPRVWLVDATPDLERGHDFSRAANSNRAELRGQDPNRAANLDALERLDSSYASNIEALKGHDFSRATNSPKNGAASAAEGSLYSAPSEVSPVDETIHRLLAGQIVAIKGIGGFHLCVDALNEAAVQRLRHRKHRYGKPLAVMVRDLDAARAFCDLSTEEEVLLTTPARPIVLARGRGDSGIAPSVAPGIPWLGIYLPYAPLQHLLFADPRVRALVMTSANLSEEPIAIDNDEARTRLGQIADAFLLHDREILQRCDDSVVAVVDGTPQVIRRARGYVPLGVPLPLALEAPPLLAVGGHLKSVFTLARGRFACQSQHLGDLENLTGLDFFRESLAHLMRTFEIEPQVVVHDLHPGYLSTTWAKEWAAERGLPVIAVQHHHAHIAACMAEHGLEGPVIGLSLDGTGYGTDGRIWGGEVLLARLDSFERFAHLDYVPMPGGESAIREPWRMAFGALHAAGIPIDEIRELTGASEQEMRILRRMMERSLNTPFTSSLGRLFDAVAAIVLQRREVDYEAQAAIELEGIAIDESDDEQDPRYSFELKPGDWSRREASILYLQRMWHAILADLRSGVGKARIAARFHAAVAEAFVQAAVLAREATGAKQVALSGGCLHNRRIVRLLRAKLAAEGFEVFRHTQVSPGDGGLSYGQAAVATAILNRETEQSELAAKS